MATFKPVVRTPRKDGFYKVYIRVVHKIKPGYISTDKLVTKQYIDKDGNIMRTRKIMLEVVGYINF